MEHTGWSIPARRESRPGSERPLLYKQLAGINWPPMSYDVEPYVLYVCANDSMGVVNRNGEEFGPPQHGHLFLGGSFARGSQR